MKLEPLGDSAVVATLGSGIDEVTLAAVLSLAEAIGSSHRRGVTDVVPAYATVTVFYNPLQFSDSTEDVYGQVVRFMESCVSRAKASPRSQRETVEIPVCYGGEFGPDLPSVAAHCGLAESEVIAGHSSAEYLVHAIGFTPGFPYLGGLPDSLRTPRLDTPRARVPAGSLGIGGSQTGVYPVISPGGWRIIGRTPLVLFRPRLNPAALLKPGDHVRFRPISAGELTSWK